MKRKTKITPGQAAKRDYSDTRHVHRASWRVSEEMAQLLRVPESCNWEVES